MISSGVQSNRRRRWRMITSIGIFMVAIYIVLNGYLVMLHHSALPHDDCFFCSLYHQASRVPSGDTTPTVALAMDHDSFPYPKIVHNTSSLTHSAPIVVQLRGELGNHLSTIAHGIGLQLMALQDFNLSTHLLLRHQTTADGSDNPKWVRTSETLQRCFPFMKDWQFSLGSQWTDFDRKYKQQDAGYRQYLEDANSNQENFGDPLCQQKAMWYQHSALVNGKPMVGHDAKEPVTEKDLAEALEAFANLWRTEREMQEREHDNSLSPTFLSMPFLYSDSMDNMVLMERFLPVFRKIFRIDPACCGDQLPEPDESVFHFRNFAREFHTSPRDTLPSFEEVTPHQAAHVLFAPVDKVAITSRFPDDPIVQEYVKALEERGIQARVVASDSNDDMYDFCFLLRAKKEIVGNFRSTFALWAALLGDAERVRLYTIQSPGLKQRFGPFIKQMFVGNYSWDLLRESGGGNDSQAKHFQKHLEMKLIPV